LTEEAPAAKAEPEAEREADWSLPTWDEELSLTEEAPAAKAEPEAEREAGWSVPTWDEELSLTEEAPAAKAEAEAEAAEDWFASWEAADTEAAEAKASATAAGWTAPSWTREDAEPGAAEAEVPSDLEEEPSTGWLPPWLDQETAELAEDLQVPAELEELSLTEAAEPTEEEGVPAAASAAEEPSSKLPSITPQTGELALSAEEIEALLGEAAAPEPPPVPEELLAEAESQAQKPTPDTGELDRAQVPEWLRQAAPTAETPSAPSAVEEILQGPREETVEEVSEALIGIPDVLPAAPDVTRQGVRSRVPLTLRLTRRQEQRAQWLQELLQAEKQPRTRGTPWATLRFGWLRALVGFALVVAIALLISSPWQLNAPPMPHPAWRLVFDAVEALPPQAPVLVAVDTSWATAPEVRQVAGPLLVHLARKQAQVIQVATVPWGVGVLSPPEEASSPWQNMGYMPGGEVWLAQLSRALPYALTAGAHPWPPESLSSWRNVQTVAQTSLVVVVTDSPEQVRLWAEQVAPYVGEDSGLVFALSSQAAPWAEPYLAVKGVRGGLLGVEAGLAYAQALGLDTSEGQLLWSRYQAVWILGAVLMVLAVAGAGLLRRLIRRAMGEFKAT